MAQKQQTILECDLDKEGERRPGETITFWNSRGQQHEIEVCEEHRKDIDEVLAALDSFTTEARRIGPSAGLRAPRQRGRSSAPSSNGTLDPKAVREWAQSQGITVNERGRIARTVEDAYRAAH